MVPLYNRADGIRACLDSILAQSHAADEIIVVNDGSTDGGDRIVRRLYGGRVTLLDQPNRGVSHARNSGIRAARNELIGLLDADDEWLPDCLAEFAGLASRFPDSQLYSVGFWIEERERIIRPDDGVSDGFFGELDFLDAYVRAIGIVSSSSVCIRKSNFDAGLVFPEGKRRGEDIYYWIRLALLGRMAFSAKRLARINRDEQTDTFASRVGDVPYYIEWITESMSGIGDAGIRRRLTTILREHSLKTGLLAVEFGERGYLRKLSRTLRGRQPLLSAIVTALCVVPGWSVRLARRARS